MTREVIELLQIDNLTAGQTMTITCPVGNITYDHLQFFHDTITAAELTDIKLILAGKTIQEYATGTEMNAINDYHGRQTTANYLDFYFTNPAMQTLASQRMTALGMQGVSSMTISAKIDAAAAVGSPLAWAQLSEGQLLGMIPIVKRFNYNASAGDNQRTRLAIGPTVHAIHLQAADITDVRFKREQTEYVEKILKAHIHNMQSAVGRVPQTAAYTHIDFVLEGDPTQALILDGNNDRFVLAFAKTAGANMAIIVESVGGIESA